MAIIAATLIDTNGSIYVERDGSRVDLSAGDNIYEDDVIITGPETVANITFLDDTKSQLSPDTELRIADFNFTTGEESLVMNLVEGAIRATSGKVVEANPLGFEVITPTATVGIRGTEFMANANGTFLLLFISEGKVMVVTRASDGQSVFLNSANQGVTIPRGDAIGDDLEVREYTPEEFQEILRNITDPDGNSEEENAPDLSSLVVFIQADAVLNETTQALVDALVDLGAIIEETDVSGENGLEDEEVQDLAALAEELLGKVAVAPVEEGGPDVIFNPHFTASSILPESVTEGRWIQVVQDVLQDARLLANADMVHNDSSTPPSIPSDDGVSTFFFATQRASRRESFLIAYGSSEQMRALNEQGAAGKFTLPDIVAPQREDKR